MRWIPLSLVLLLAGCTGGLLAPSGAPPKLYTLTAPASVPTNAPHANWQLLVDMPDAILDLNSARIATAPSPERVDYYADVSWADRPPAMIQELLLQSFDRSGRIAAVQRQGAGLKADFALSSDIQDFEVEAGPQPGAHVRLTERLVRTRDRTIVATRVFEARVPVNGGFDDAIAAFDSALGSLLPQIVDWTLTEGSRNS
jgi:cholesterol transport system auxiliary component